MDARQPLGGEAARTHAAARSSPDRPAATGSPAKPARKGCELLALQRLAGNAAVQRLLSDRRPLGGTSAPPTGAATGGPAAIPQRPLTRTAFETMMVDRYGIATVRTGTLASQVAHLNFLGGPVTPGVPRPGELLQQLVDAGALTWSEWSPGSSSEIYNGIAKGLEDFARSFGGIPPVNEITFYRAAYETTSAAPGLAASSGEGASYSGGKLTVYATAATTPKRLPLVRDDPGSPAYRPDPGAVESMASYTAHELGHGLQEVGLTPPAPAPGLMREYERAVGWISGRLYDIADPHVEQAVARGLPPPGATPITRHNWDSGRWQEQPLSAYMATSPFEDFPEAVMAFVRAPGSLQSRSPHRYAFIESRRLVLAPHLRAVALPPARPDVGDFPAPAAGARIA